MVLYSCPQCHHKVEKDDKLVMLICQRCQEAMNIIEKPNYTMRCEKCGKEFPESEIHEHHCIPKGIGGTDKDGKYQLCKKHHDILHEMLLKQVWKFVPCEKQEECKKHLQSFTKWWVNLKRGKDGEAIK